MEKYHTNTPDAPPDYELAVKGMPPPQGQGQASPYPHGSVPYQPSGFQANNAPAPSEWYIGAPGSGFDLFDNHEELIVERSVDLMEAVLHISSGQLKRQFRVSNKDNQQLFFLEEDESFLSNYDQRAYNFTAKNSHGEAVFVVSRDMEKCPCCYCCVQSKACRSEAKITNPQSQLIGTLLQRLHCNEVRFALEDPESREIMKVAGGNAVCNPPSVYQLEMMDGESKGTIVKQGSPWGGSLNKYTVKFPPNMDGKLKACCIAVVVHFDFRFHFLQIRNRSHND